MKRSQNVQKEKVRDVTFTAKDITVSKAQYEVLEELAGAANWDIGQTISYMIDVGLSAACDVWEEIPFKRQRELIEIVESDRKQREAKKRLA